ncbi:MAG: hypothetical protein ACXU9G_08250 [Syntrophales bacterium]
MTSKLFMVHISIRPGQEQQRLCRRVTKPKIDYIVEYDRAEQARFNSHGAIIGAQ